MTQIKKNRTIASKRQLRKHVKQTEIKMQESILELIPTK